MPRPKAQRPETVPWPQLTEERARRLRWARKERGYSLRDLSIASGVSERTIREIESGKAGGRSVDAIAALADALFVSRGWLAYGG